jgi:4'-phosphopantetheinyl transferase
MPEKSDVLDSLRGILGLEPFDVGSFPSLAKGEIHIWTVSIEELGDHIDRLRSVLSAVEYKRASYFKYARAQHHYTISQAMLRLLLSSYLDIEPDDVTLGARRKGKPYLIHDRKLYFNISNSHDLCVYAFSTDGEVGIDIEKIRELPDIQDLIHKNLTPSEREYVLKDPEKMLERFFMFWTYKEAYLKTIGEGMRLTPENLEFSVENGIIKLNSVKYGFDATHWNFNGFTPAKDYTGTLVHEGGVKHLRFFPA